MRAPRKLTSPTMGRINPLSARMSVVLPAPLPPSTATSSPLAISSDAITARHGRGAIARRERAHGQQEFFLRRQRALSPAVGLLADAKISLAHGRRCRDFERRAFCDLGAGVEHDDVARNAHDQLHVVLDQDNCDPDGGELAQQYVDRRRVLGVKPGSRLIEREHGGANGQRAGDLDETLVDVGKRAGRPVDRSDITDEGEQAFGDRAAASWSRFLRSGANSALS